MAKKTKVKQSLADVVEVGDDRDELLPVDIKGSRFSYVKELYSRCPGKLMKTNLLMVLFLLPALIWLIYITIIADNANSLLPYSANLGIGYPVVNGIAGMAASYQTYFNMVKYTILVLLIMIASLGFAGGTYTVRQIMQDEKVKIFKTFFRGIKTQAMPWLWFGFILGVELLIMMVVIYYYDYVVIMQPILKKIIQVILCIIIGFIMLISICVGLIYTTQNVCFIMKSKALLKNSFLYTFRLPLQNVCMLVLTIGPSVLVGYLISLYMPSMGQNNFFMVFIATFGIIILALYLCSFIVLCWSVYGDLLYENSIVVARERIIKNAKKGKK